MADRRRARIAHQALAAEYRLDPGGNAQPFQDRFGRDGIGRRDDRTQRKRRRPRADWE